MSPKLIRAFVLSAGLCFLITGMAKAASSLGSAGALDTADPIFDLSFRRLFMIVGLAEIGVSIYCFVERRVGLTLFVIAAVSTLIALYRLGLIWLEYSKPCTCLGTFVESIGMRPEIADSTMKGVLVYLLLGSIGSLVFIRLIPVKSK